MNIDNSQIKKPNFQGLVKKGDVLQVLYTFSLIEKTYLDDQIRSFQPRLRSKPPLFNSKTSPL